MANLQVKNMPDALHKRLRRQARQNDTTIRSVVISAVERELAWMEWQERFNQRAKTNPDSSPAALLIEERMRCADED